MIERYALIVNRRKDPDLAVAHRICDGLNAGGKHCVITEPAPGANGDTAELPPDTQCVIVLGGDGTIFVSSTAGVTAVAPNGTKKWFAPVSAGCEVWGSPAVDKNGFVYATETATDQTAGKLVKINPEGVKVSELTLGQAACSSPTIGPDGTVYCTSTKDSKPTLTAVKGTADGPAAGWSQLGGGYRKTCKAE